MAGMYVNQSLITFFYKQKGHLNQANLQWNQSRFCKMQYLPSHATLYCNITSDIYICSWPVFIMSLLLINNADIHTGFKANRMKLIYFLCCEQTLLKEIYPLTSFIRGSTIMEHLFLATDVKIHTMFTFVQIHPSNPRI